MKNEVRFYLENIKAAIADGSFVPKVMVIAVVLETGAIEVITNTSDFATKVDYLLEAYDEAMRHKHNTAVFIANLMVV